MHSYQIISDSSCDLPAELLQTLQVGIVPYYASFDTVQYHKELLELTAETFYDQIQNSSVFPKTSMPPIPDYMDVFEPYLKAGKDVLCICLTSKFSGSYQSAHNAKQILLDTYPQRRIEVLDSINVTATQGMLVREACRMRDAGYDLDRLIAVLQQLKHTSKIYFTVDSLQFLQHGGRVGKAAALAGALLNIKPIIAMKEGELFPERKVRGHKKALKTLLEMTQADLSAQKERYQLCVIRAGKELEAEAQSLIAALSAEGYAVEPKPWTIGVTIGTHAGPTAIGICYMQPYETIAPAAAQP